MSGRLFVCSTSSRYALCPAGEPTPGKSFQGRAAFSAAVAAE